MATMPPTTLEVDLQLGDNLARVTALEAAVRWWGDYKPCTDEQVVNTAERFRQFLTAGQDDTNPDGA